MLRAGMRGPHCSVQCCFGFKGLWMWYDSKCLMGFYHTQPCLETPVSSKCLTEEWGQRRIGRCDVQKDISAQRKWMNLLQQPKWFKVGTRPWSHINWTTLEVHISCFDEYFFMVWQCFCRLLVFIVNELCWTQDWVQYLYDLFYLYSWAQSQWSPWGIKSWT